MSDFTSHDPTMAPADARPHRSWSRGAKVVAYAVLFVLALVSIWFINRRVDALAADGAAGHTCVQPVDFSFQILTIRGYALS